MAAPTSFQNIHIMLNGLENDIKNHPEKLKNAPFKEINRIKNIFNGMKMGADAQAYNEVALKINHLEIEIRTLADKFDRQPEATPSVNKATVDSAIKKPIVAQIEPPKPATPVQQQNRIGDIRAKMQREMPVLASLVANYQQGKSIKLPEYEKKYLEVMINELGFPINEVYSVSKMGKIMEPKEILEIFEKLREKLQIQDVVFLPYDDAPANARPFGSFLTGEGHNSFAVHQNGVYKVCPEYSEDQSQNNQPTAKSINPNQLDAACQQPIELKVAPIVVQKNELYTGKITNMNSCALESCIFSLAYLLA